MNKEGEKLNFVKLLIKELATEDILSFSPLSTVVLMSALSLLPFLFFSVTAFAKVSCVLSILKNALGLGQVPSQMVIASLSLVISVYVFLPVGSKILKTAEDTYSEIDIQKKAKTNPIETATLLYSNLSAPLTKFLRMNSNMEERVYFQSRLEGLDSVEDNEEENIQFVGEDCEDSRLCDLRGENLFTLLPAFLLTELKEAFTMGLVLLVPFLIVDLLVATVLTGLGMVMVSPVTISLPFKVGLFVMADGWLLITEGILEGYFWVG